MSSVQLSLVKAAALAFAGVSLLSSASLQAAEALKQLGNPEGALDIIAWPGYIERGESDKNYDWVSQFEKDSGCKVNSTLR